MGCNCGRGASGTIADRARQEARRRAGINTLGKLDDNPIIIGDPGGDVLRVRAQVAVPGKLTVGQAAYVSGDGVAALLENNHLIDITKRQQKRRVFTVNGMTFFDEQKANRAGAALGVTPIEVA